MVSLVGDGSTPFFAVDSGSSLTIDNLTLSNGKTLKNGGAIDNEGSLAINNSTLTGNSAGGSGGAVFSNGPLSLDGSNFVSNVAVGHGGAIASTGPISATDSTFSDNSAGLGFHGGAINLDTDPSRPISVFSSDTFTANTAGDGGAIAAGTNSPVLVTNSTVTGNSATGGSAFYPYTNLSLSYDTIAANDNGGAAIQFGPNFGVSQIFAITGTILDNASNCSVPYVDDHGSNLTYQGDACGLTQSSDIDGSDPRLGTLQDNGGQTHTMAPSPDSPTVGAGSCTDLSGPNVSQDQRGATRPSSHCTIGAYESDGANGTWVNAQTLDQTTAGYAVNQTVSQHIYSTGQERWFQFPVTPGSQVHIQYTGQPGGVVSLHSDLRAEYNAITQAQGSTSSTTQAPSSGFLPQQFLPQQFLPQQFLPQQFLPQQFLPQQFLPQQFLPQQFLPQQFLPQQFLPQQFLPQQFLPAPYSGAVYGSLLAASTVPSSGVQTIDHNTWNSFGYMYVRVAGPPSLTTPFTLTVTETGGTCSNVTPVPFTPPSPPASATNLRSLILWDPTRTAGLSSDITNLGPDLSTFAARPEVDGAVINLNTVPGVEAAQSQADANNTCPAAKNLVAQDIKSIIQGYRSQNPGLKYVVLIGDDYAIPYFRYPDESGLGTESQFYPPVADGTSSNASLRTTTFSDRMNTAAPPASATGM